MKRWSFIIALVAGLAWADEPSKLKDEAPREESGQAWSVIGARTVAPQENLFIAEAGYPTVNVSFLRGIVAGLNLGGRVGFMYGVEGLPRDLAPGVKAQALLKFRFFDSGRVSLGLTFEPGFFVASSALQGVRGALNLPIGFRLGIAASSALAIAIQLEVPMWIEFGTFGGFNAPILTGGGLEYFITSHLALFAKARVGPTIRTNRPAEVAFDASLGVGYHFK